VIWAPFLRAVEVDPAFALPYQHLLDKPARAVDKLRWIDGLLAASAEGWEDWGTRRGALLARNLLLGGEFDPDSMAETIGVGSAINLLAHTQDAEDALLRLLESDLAVRWAATRPGGQQIDILTRDVLLHRGHLAEGRALVTVKPDNEDDAMAQFMELALLGAIPADSASRVAAYWLAEADTDNLYYAIPWWSQVGDTAALVRASEMFHTPRAYLALARGDTADAIRRFSETTLECKPCRLIYATLLDLVGQEDDAAAVLDSGEVSSRLAWMHSRRQFRRHLRPSAFSVLYQFERGRASERVGYRNRAIEAYTYVTDMWANADSILQVNYVEQAKEGLRRLMEER
jgi:hypothetical protein